MCCCPLQVLHLTADKQRLSKQLAGLQADNHELSSLVLDLSDTLQQQQQQARMLLQLQRASLLHVSAGRLQLSPTKNPLQHTKLQAAAASVETFSQIMQNHQQELQQQHEQQQMQGDRVCDQEDEAVAEVSITLPRIADSPEPSEEAQQQQQQQGGSTLHADPVNEWLEHQGWLEWQEKLPLEPMSSSSSSSLILALEDSLMFP